MRVANGSRDRGSRTFPTVNEAPWLHGLLSAQDATPASDLPMIYVFEDCVLDTGRYMLRRGGDPCPMEPQVFDVLAYLVRNRGRLVTKEELLDEVWGTRFLSEASLTSRIRAARKVVGDSGSRQTVIRTVRGSPSRTKP